MSLPSFYHFVFLQIPYYLILFTIKCHLDLPKHQNKDRCEFSVYLRLFQGWNIIFTSIFILIICDSDWAFKYFVDGTKLQKYKCGYIDRSC
ncbi:unnamed protein product [Acanthoscelides obtectus]|uniref:Uncharacterized protein n=1 Tax=Acanthoscelides obtectus TaxID=200917 RepID=A0A9P0LAI8_ACAOB|nr:unnamed protein product [Acanthoscelides obtectus]CAK1620862.1 hypothetical protein AOBTE_LOCUS623 [Acanthoscelides obtectus]